MDILIYTHVFPPMVGGIETITMELAQRLSGSVHSVQGDSVRVTLVTPKPIAAPRENELPFRIIRKPSLMQLAKLIRAPTFSTWPARTCCPYFWVGFSASGLSSSIMPFKLSAPMDRCSTSRRRTPCPGHYMAGNICGV